MSTQTALKEHALYQHDVQEKERLVYYDPSQRKIEGRTDWARIEALTDSEIEAAMRDDSDWAQDLEIDWSKAKIVNPRKKQAVSIRLDEDIITFFKDQGKGYQTRINAVLRSFIEAKQS